MLKSVPTFKFFSQKDIEHLLAKDDFWVDYFVYDTYDKVTNSKSKIGDFIFSTLILLDQTDTNPRLRHAFDNLINPYFNPNTETCFENALERFGNVLFFKEKFFVVSARIANAWEWKCSNLKEVQESDQKTGYDHYSVLIGQLEDLIIDCVSFYQGVKVYLRRIQ